VISVDEKLKKFFKTDEMIEYLAATPVLTVNTADGPKDAYEVAIKVRGEVAFALIGAKGEVYAVVKDNKAELLDPAFTLADQAFDMTEIVAGHHPMTQEVPEATATTPHMVIFVGTPEEGFFAERNPNDKVVFVEDMRQAQYTIEEYLKDKETGIAALQNVILVSDKAQELDAVQKVYTDKEGQGILTAALDNKAKVKEDSDVLHTSELLILTAAKLGDLTFAADYGMRGKKNELILTMGALQKFVERIVRAMKQVFETAKAA
jgi:hypothetical protein